MLSSLPNPVAIFKKPRRSRSVTKKVVVEDLSQRLIPIAGFQPLALVLHDLLSPDECASLIRRAEDQGFDDALIQGPGGEQILRQDIRRCRRCIVDDASLADVLHVRIFDALRGTGLEKKIAHAPWVTSRSPNPGDESDVITAVGLNERMRILKYKTGHFFAPHQDISYVRGADCGDKAGETSYVTVQVYLNDKFKGGATRFLSGKRYYDVKPRMGSVLIFDHDLLHEGSKIAGGTKYLVRTDVMYTRQGSPGR